MFEVLQVVDIANLIVASVSLLIALSALIISKRIAVAGISRPFVLQGLYELYEDINELGAGKTIYEDIDRSFKAIKLVRKKSLILEQMGFEKDLKEMEEHLTNYVQLREKLQGADDETLHKEGNALIQHVRNIDLKVLEIQKQLKPKLEAVLKNPLAENPSAR